ncbi:hypothetical protein ABEF85_14730 [Acinetobacter thermotolerans]|uniref:hypothetical protein n=1 Tax=Acinetobacter thermotolerans TaxID=3151487 RepID=UPI00325B6B71
MSENNLYYIYIDSKIEGTVDQLISYFQTNVFNKYDCICICFKYYKVIEKYIKKNLEGLDIPYKFIKRNSDLSFESGKTIFYLFNAQSNCKITVRRDLTHIFVSHGESHKLASIKPIFRIYDFVITSGQVGIERFLKAGIFNSYNIQHESRVLPMGDTFIGQNPYVFAPNDHSLLYAPTWEGGVPSENYSSVGEKATDRLYRIIEKYKITTLYIQPHPNLGHRDQSYISRFKRMIRNLKKLSIDIIIIKNHISFTDRLNYKGCKLVQQYLYQSIGISMAVVDISAMEMQLLNKHIPILVLFEDYIVKDLVIPKRVQHLYDLDRSLNALNIEDFDFDKQLCEIERNYDYFISYHEEHLKFLSFKQRIQWLCQFGKNTKAELMQKNVDL